MVSVSLFSKHCSPIRPGVDPSDTGRSSRRSFSDTECYVSEAIPAFKRRSSLGFSSSVEQKDLFAELNI